ncbi:DotU family type IV/VI secretion system protein [Thermodesulfobacteriota bacterium B35]
MQMVDCFIELIAYVTLFLETAAQQQPDFERVSADLSGLVAAAETCRQEARLPAEDFDLARFAVFAWIDEAILGSAWQEKNRWQGEQLQRRYYQTAEAGEEFFEKLNSLGPHQQQVREVYYLCLALGFTGRYCNPGDEFLLEQLKNSNLRLLVGDAPDLSAPDGTVLFADAYPGEGGVPGAQRKAGRRLPLEVVAGIVLPVLLFGGLFLIYRFVLANIGRHFLGTV